MSTVNDVSFMIIVNRENAVWAAEGFFIAEGLRGGATFSSRNTSMIFAGTEHDLLPVSDT